MFGLLQKRISRQPIASIADIPPIPCDKGIGRKSEIPAKTQVIYLCKFYLFWFYCPLPRPLNIGVFRFFKNSSPDCLGCVAIFLAVVVADIAEYFIHLALHEVPFLWRFHAIHHS